MKGIGRKRSVLTTLFGRRTIRLFRPGSIGSSVVRLIIEAGQRAPCSYQAYSVIEIASEDKRRRLVEITGEQAIGKAAVTLLVCIDFRRLSAFFDLLTREHVLKRDKHPLESVEAVLEAGLFLENMIIAAEAVGLGSVILDAALFYSREVAGAVGLPRGVVPLVFLCIGHPAEKPPERPRLPLDMIHHVDQYREPDPRRLSEYLKYASERLTREGYLMKYAGLRMPYSEYLAEKVGYDKELEKIYSALSSFLQSNGLRI